MLKENKLPIINDNATKEELDKMVRDMLENGPINLCKRSFSENEPESEHESIA